MAKKTKDLHYYEAVGRRKESVARVRLYIAGKDKSASVKGKKIAVWGLSFKPRTDDVREAPSLLIIETLLKNGASVVAFDPVATENAKESLKSHPRLKFSRDQYAATDGADALVVATEWDEFRTADFADLAKRMRGNVIVDGRNIFERDEAEAAGFTYYGVGV